MSVTFWKWFSDVISAYALDVCYSEIRSPHRGNLTHIGNGLWLVSIFLVNMSHGYAYHIHIIDYRYFFIALAKFCDMKNITLKINKLENFRFFNIVMDNVFHGTKNQVRRRTLHLKIILKMRLTFGNTLYLLRTTYRSVTDLSGFYFVYVQKGNWIENIKIIL